ncbi:class I SAM-dependent methyltransferase [Paenalkalicoccus suaedae]|uniref:Class I SAM-dependent methyltransferase n=1 Tax=Paenalkalicoccus suaedae TaxID=2592382 RepID=A0A859FCL2_9BACI|nr:class I SAM-dependent methyltransferase [Paenalkalicoccus suaedae]QKS70502.1 class I SAM-dependent methyltransferase [Paenalkalicoccus suaedae]
MDVSKHNSVAWDKKVAERSTYTQAVSREVIERGKRGDWEIGVTTTKSVPRNWFPLNMDGVNVLCVGSGGGQQAPVLAAAGASVTVVDISSAQIAKDEYVARENGLELTTYLADMTKLDFLESESFDMVVHPVSNLFVANVQAVWDGIARVLKRNGVLIAGFTNPLLWIFDDESERRGMLDVKHPIPSSTLDHLPAEKHVEFLESKQTIEYAHTLEQQIKGQLQAGLVMTGFYEDDFGGSRMIDTYIKTFMATRAVKMRV